MAASYSIIQYVPDPVADERINVGVLVFDERRVRARFIKGWGRLQRFGSKDVSFLKSFAEEITERCKATLFTEGQIDSEMIRRVAATWRDSIQLTEPRGSLLNLDALHRDAEKRFLAGDKPGQLRPITKNSLRALALKEAEMAFSLRGGSMARQLIRPSYEVAGRVEPHRFSLAIANGHPLVAAEVFSFIGIDQRGQERDVRAGAWAFDDVRKQNSDLPLAALVLRDTRATPAYQNAERIFRGLDVAIVPKEEVPGWAEKIADRVLAGGGAELG